MNPFNQWAKWARSGLVSLVTLLPFHAMATSEVVGTSSQSSTGLESGAMTPFSICTTQSPNYVVPQYLPGSGLNFTAVNGNFCQKHFWLAAPYNANDRLTKGAEACGSPSSYKDGWYGFLFYLPDAAEFTMTGAANIAQLFQGGYCNSWAGLIAVKANNLVVYHRSFCGDPTIATLATNLPRKTWIPVLINFRVSSQGAGYIKIWVNGAPESTPTYNYTGNFGFAHGWNSDDTLPADSPIGGKVGLYTTPDGDEISKTIYYDNICWLNTNPPGAFNLVNPLNAANTPVPFAAASNNAANEIAVNAFDGDTATKWFAPTTDGTAWLLYNFGGESRVVTRYDVSSANDVSARDPKNWNFQGSQDGIAWIPLDTQTNQTFASRYLTKKYPIGNTAAYKYYRLNITANNGDTGSIQLSELAFTYGNGLPPATPTGVSATSLSPTQINLAWTASSGATSYTVRRSTVATGPFAVVSSGVSGTTYSDNGLAASTRYYYRITASNTVGESADSLVAGADTPPSDGSATYPVESASYGGGTTLDSNNAGFNGTGFINFPSNGGYVDFTNVNGGGGGPATLFIRNALVSGTRTGLLIVNGVSQSISFPATGGWSNWTDKIVAITLVSGTGNTIRLQSNGQDLANVDEITVRPSPAAPTGLAASTVSDSQIHLVWTTSFGAVSYTLERSTTSGSGFGVLAAGLTTTTFEDTGLGGGLSYFYRVRSVNLSGASANSAESGATTYTPAQSWRLENFGTIADTGDAADSADPDGDGMTNAQEQTAGTDPNAQSSVLKIIAFQESGNDVNITFSTVVGKSYRVERSDTLATGSWTPALTDGVPADSIAGTGNPVQITDTDGALQPKRFYRVVCFD